ncbi:hypothetical protein [Nitrobacter sp. TKz-YC01]|uniref:hypothetical protein n=1 Tax=Nitrobacter sp. TKz-YC01 TaxID=3398703 RepID=UPI003A0FBB76
MTASAAHDHETITVHVPLTFPRRGGRKQIVLPDGTSSWAPPRARVDNTIVKAIARGFRWRKLLETGVHATVEDIAAAEKINASYVSRVLRLTLLAPATVEAILDGRQGPDVTLAMLMRPFPVEWEKQRLQLGEV